MLLAIYGWALSEQLPERWLSGGRVLLAAACFARGSERFHRHLLAHRIAGPIVRGWEENRSMPPGVKPWAFGLMAVSFGVSLLMVPSAWHRLMLLGIAVVLAFFLWRVPVRAADAAEPQAE